MPQDWSDPRRKVRELQEELRRRRARAERLGADEAAALIDEAARLCDEAHPDAAGAASL